MILVQMLVESDEGWSESTIVGLFSDDYWANRAIREHKAEIMVMDDEISKADSIDIEAVDATWDDVYPTHSFYKKEMKPNVRYPHRP